MKSTDKPRFGHVLLVDEDEIDNFVNERMITTSNFADQITVRSSALHALKYLREKLSDPEDLPDFIFLDIMMPIMDGFQFLDEFEKFPDKIKEKCRIIMLSSSESFHDLNRANSNKYVYKFLNKPLSEKMLQAIN